MNSTSSFNSISSNVKLFSKVLLCDVTHKVYILCVPTSHYKQFFYVFVTFYTTAWLCMKGYILKDHSFINNLEYMHMLSKWCRPVSGSKVVKSTFLAVADLNQVITIGISCHYYHNLLSLFHLLNVLFKTKVAFPDQ